LKPEQAGEEGLRILKWAEPIEEQRDMKVNAPFFFIGTRRWFMAGIVDRLWQIFIADQLLAPALHDLVQVGRFGEWTECGECLTIDAREAESCTELDLCDINTGGSES